MSREGEGELRRRRMTMRQQAMRTEMPPKPMTQRTAILRRMRMFFKAQMVEMGRIRM